jgi:diadenosine tetraphosphate (Ap4A) HIT family hydrolase
MAAACIFCKIIRGTHPSMRHTTYFHDAKHTTGEIPSMKIFESEKTFAFLDIGPLSRGHSVHFHFQTGLGQSY